MYNTLLIPDCKINFAHSLHGLSVRYNVAPSADIPPVLTNLVIAFASECNVYHLVFPSTSSHSFSNPWGVPLYPSEIITEFLTIIEPTFFLFA